MRIDRDYVQRLMEEKRKLAVELERLKLDTEEARSLKSRPDPRVGILEAENRRLREELERARSERDVLQAGVSEALDRIGQR